MAGETITLNAACHCRGYSDSYTLPASAFPLKAAVCSCNSCRHVTGQLFASFAVIPDARLPAGPTLQHYAFTPNLTVIFCRVCGATVANIEPDEWEFATGVLSVPRGAQGDETREAKGKGTEGLFDRQCMFVEDVPDGGGLIWLPSENSAGREMKRHKALRKSEVLDVEAMQRDFAAKDGGGGGAKDDKLHGKCHCGANAVYITRPTPAGEPPADKIKGNKWWLADPDDPNCTKYLGRIDACDSCRLITGFEINTWIYIPRMHIFTEDASGGPARPFDADDKQLNLKHYYSSKHVLRSFCKTCGEPFCCRETTRDVEVIDFGVGIFNGRGPRCEEWIGWKGLEYGEDAMDKKMVAYMEDKAGKIVF